MVPPPQPSASPLQTILHAFPPVHHAFAYGSSIFPQPGADALRDRPPLVDFIFAVDDPLSWHAANLERNGSHYSLLLQAAGPAAVVALADSVGVGVHFNPFVRVGAQELKYGVIRTSSLLSDLSQWDTLYVAGRMQKPVATLAADERVAAASDGNLRAALACALLLLPSRFSELQLHTTLCGLSYTGDVRMGIAEDASKVHRIAEGSAGHLRQLYRGAVQRASAWRAALSPSTGSLWTQNADVNARMELVASLPPGLLRQLSSVVGLTATGHAEAVVRAVAVSPSPNELLRSALRATVRSSSRRQAVAGLISSGLGNAARYLGAKVSKAFRSRLD